MVDPLSVEDVLFIKHKELHFDPNHTSTAMVSEATPLRPVSTCMTEALWCAWHSCWLIWIKMASMSW
jgi:hypothetical protein